MARVSRSIWSAAACGVLAATLSCSPTEDQGGALLLPGGDVNFGGGDVHGTPGDATDPGGGPDAGGGGEDSGQPGDDGGPTPDDGGLTPDGGGTPQTGIPEGAIVITEIMKNPASVTDALGEWVELSNMSGKTVALDGAVLRDTKTDKHVIASGGALVLLPGDVVVLAINGDPATNGGVLANYVYSGFALGNGVDQIILESNGKVVDKVVYGGVGEGWPDGEGVSLMLAPEGGDAVTNDKPDAWCLSSAPMSGGDFGTPGATNGECSAASCGDGKLDPGEQCDDGNTQGGDGCNADCTVPKGGCGDGVIDAGEACDDGNTKPGDGCSAVCAVESPVLAGAVVISEVMYNPKVVSDTVGEWVELVNTTDSPVDIRGWTITDEKSDTHVIEPGAPLVIPAGGSVVLAANSDPTVNGGVTPDYVYKGISLGNTTDKLVLKFASADVDRVEWSIPPFPKVDGASMQLDALSLHAAMNDSASAWCASVGPYGAGDKGTPGHPNVACAAAPPACGNGTVEAGEQCDDGNKDPGDGCSATCSVEGPAPDVGSVVITELMANPKAVSDTNGEWFEVANTTDNAVDINGWTIGDGASEKHVIANAGPLVVPIGGQLVLGRNASMATNGGVPVDYQYSGINLTNTSDTLRLTASGVVVDEVAYGAGFPLGDGVSVSLDPSSTSAAANDAPQAWCLGTTAFGGGDKGTPGAPNPPCAAP